MSESGDLPIRPRRLRQTLLRPMLQRITLRRSDFILPVFVTEGTNVRREVPSMPGVFQMSIDTATAWLAQRSQEGFNAFLVFGVIERSKKDATGSAALDENNVVCKLLRSVKSQNIPMLAITDLCFCEYTSHGHCGILSSDRTTVQNDATVQAPRTAGHQSRQGRRRHHCPQRHDGRRGRRDTPRLGRERLF